MCDLEVLHRLADRGCAILAAGDEDQSIYGFRKAAPEGIRRFTSDYPGSSRYPLTVTKRCGKQIVRGRDGSSRVIRTVRPTERP